MKIRKIIRFILKKFTKTDSHEILTSLIGRYGLTSYVEVGVWKGNTILNILKRFPNLIATGIDPYEKSEYKDNCYDLIPTLSQDGFEEIWVDVDNKLMKYDNADLIRKTSKEVNVLFVENSIDMIFIDGLHDYDSVKEDIELWLPIVKKGGFLCGHDYYKYPSVAKAVNDTIGCDIRVNNATGIWMYRRK